MKMDQTGNVQQYADLGVNSRCNTCNKRYCSCSERLESGAEGLNIYYGVPPPEDIHVLLPKDVKEIQDWEDKQFMRILNREILRHAFRQALHSFIYSGSGLVVGIILSLALGTTPTMWTWIWWGVAAMLIFFAPLLLYYYFPGVKRK
jgi:hypothetical protein